MVYWSVLFVFNKDKRYKKQLVKSVILISILPFLLVALSKNLLVKADVLYDKSNERPITNYLAAFCNRHSMSNGRYGNCIEFYNRYGEQLEFEDKLFYSKAFFLSDAYYNFDSRFSNYYLRTKRLFQIGSQSGFYYGRLENIEQSTQQKLNHYFTSANTIFSTVFVLAVFICVGLLVSNIRSKNYVRKEAVFPLIFMSIIVMALGLLSENQPRYLFMGWGLWTLSLVGIFEGLIRKKKIDQSTDEAVESISFKFNIVSLGIFVLMGFVVLNAYKYLMSGSNYLLVDMRGFSDPTCSTEFSVKECLQAKLNVVRTTSEKPNALLKLKHPVGLFDGASVSSQLQISVNPDALYTLSFFVQTPYNRSDNKSGFFDINIYVNNQLEKTLNLSDTNEYRFIKVSDVKSESGKLNMKFEIVSNVNHKANSWINASLTKFEFLAVRKQ